jgi:TolB-like protein/Flp pilus assembly protein TadD
MTEESPRQTASGRDVFVSYASHDADVAQKACSALEAAGFRCWIAPRDVIPGTLYADGIVGAIDESRILVLILSKDAVASAHVGKELERATSKRHPIIALRLDTAPLTRAFEYFLNESQWIEGGASDPAIAKLVDAVGQHLAPGTVAGQTHTSFPRTAARAAMPQRVWVIAAVVVAVLLAGAYFLVDQAQRSKHETTAGTAVISDKSIAVLPFTDMSEKKDQEYFADGMAEEIINLLVKIPGLKVISRTSSFQFKGKNPDLQSIATQLGVAYVLQGSVRKSGDHLRVTAQLIDSRNGTQLFSQTYDRDLSDVLKMQDEIAASLVRTLQIQVSGEAVVSRPALRNTEAYTVYLQGLHAFNRFDPQGLEQAAQDFQQAVDLDPSFADARVWFAITNYSMGAFGFVPSASTTSAFEQARQSAELALKLDPNVATAHAVLGLVDLNEGNWASADQELQLARALVPGDYGIIVLAEAQAMTMGRWDDALKHANARLERDPLDPIGYVRLSAVQLRRGRLAEAETAMRRALEISPTFGFAHYNLGVVLLARAEPDAALKEFTKDSIDGARLKGTAMAYFALGRRSESDTALAEWLQESATSHFPFSVAELYAFRRQSDAAFKWLDVAFEQKDTNILNAKSSVLLDSLHGDPRYAALLKKMNLPDD